MDAIAFFFSAPKPTAISSLRYPSARPSLDANTFFFSHLSLSSSFSSSTCNAISLSKSQSQDQKRLRHEAVQQFLLNQCGFSHSQLTQFMTKNPVLFRAKSIHRAQQVVQLLLDSGFTAPQVRKTILTNPFLLGLNQNQLKPKIDLLSQTVCNDPQDLAHLISQQPRILSSSLSKNLVPKIPLLVKLFGSKANISKALKRAPVLLNCDGIVTENVENRLKLMESIGLTQEEVKELLQKDAKFLTFSSEKIKRNMEFLTRVAGYSPNIVVKYPFFLTYSIEKRMNPRYKVFQYVTEIWGAEDVSHCLNTMLTLSEEKFAERFLCSPGVAELYEKYMGKSVDLVL